MSIESQLKQKIQKLIESKQEGQYWDFKEKHHDNKASLLHDILCLSNAIHNGDRYLIFGVCDPRENCEIKGISNQNRRSQTDIIDFVRSKKFAGDIRPEIELRTIEIENKVVDILTIFNRVEKPYYIAEDYRDKDKCVRANNIYTRNIDTNTPIDKSADINLITLMWREQFRLDLLPLERIEFLLEKPENWISINEDSQLYHKEFPEFTVREGKEIRNPFQETWTDRFPDPNSSSYEVELRYFETIIHKETFVLCDGGRHPIPLPKIDMNRIDNKNKKTFYILRNSLAFKVAQIFPRHYPLQNALHVADIELR